MYVYIYICTFWRGGREGKIHVPYNYVQLYIYTCNENLSNCTKHSWLLTKIVAVSSLFSLVSKFRATSIHNEQLITFVQYS